MNLKYLRKGLKLSQIELSEKLNMSQTTYSNYEIGRNDPDIATLNKFADFFKVSIDTLVGREFMNIDFARLSETKTDLIAKIADMDEADCVKLLGYIDGMKNK